MKVGSVSSVTNIHWQAQELEAQITAAVETVAKERLSMRTEILFFPCKSCWTHADNKIFGFGVNNFSHVLLVSWRQDQYETLFHINVVLQEA
jgi:hypothetical protein